MTDEQHRLIAEAIVLLNLVLDGDETPEPIVPATAETGLLTVNTALELIAHEAIVQEAYLDSVGVWTWSVGVTNATGHDVSRYKDKPQTIERCLEVFLWAVNKKYVPAVRKTFEGRDLTEAQFASALSFHYNTGAIAKALWVKQWLAGQVDIARQSFMGWSKPKEIIPRRLKERDLFFDGKWSNDGRATVFPVKKPSYRPDFAKGKRIDIRPILQGLMA